MPVTLTVNGLTVVHAGSNGLSTAFPDVCKVPTPAGPVPLPFPNIARSADASKTARTVKADGHPVCVADSVFIQSSGNEAATAGGGVVSSRIKGKAEFVSFSFDTRIEGKQVPRALDLMLHNDKNTPPAPLVQGPASPLAPHDGHWLEVELRDEKDRPVPGVGYRVVLGDGRVATGTLDQEGFACVVGIEVAAPCEISFPDLDRRAWELVKSTSARPR